MTQMLNKTIAIGSEVTAMFAHGEKWIEPYLGKKAIVLQNDYTLSGDPFLDAIEVQWLHTEEKMWIYSKYVEKTKEVDPNVPKYYPSYI